MSGHFSQIAAPKTFNTLMMEVKLQLAYKFYKKTPPRMYWECYKVFKIAFFKNTKNVF